jgi:hypothetical protein
MSFRANSLPLMCRNSAQQERDGQFAHHSEKSATRISCGERIGSCAPLEDRRRAAAVAPSRNRRSGDPNPRVESGARAGLARRGDAGDCRRARMSGEGPAEGGCSRTYAGMSPEAKTEAAYGERRQRGID